SARLPWALRDAWRARLGPDRMRIALYAWWIVAVVGFFSLPSSKLVGYVLPALAPWCLLLAMAAASFPRARRAAMAIGALICVGAVVVLTLRLLHSSRPAAQAIAASWHDG